MAETFTPREPDRTANLGCPSADADAAEADTPDEVHPQRVIVTTDPHWYHNGLVIHGMKVTT
jgi:hypothetical protein